MIGFDDWKKEIDDIARDEFGDNFCSKVLISEGNWMDGMTH